MRKMPIVSVSILVVTALGVAIANEAPKDRLIDQVRYIPMEGLKSPLPIYHDDYRRFVFGNTPEVRPQGIIVAKENAASLRVANTIVLGFPCLLNFRLSLQSTHSWWTLDLAASADPAVSVNFYIVQENGHAYSLRRGPAHHYRYESKRPMSVGAQQLDPGGELSMWFDLYHLMSGRFVLIEHSDRTEYEIAAGSPIGFETILHPGKSKVVMVFSGPKEAANEEPAVFVVRDPDPAEEAFLADIGYDGEIRSWFPDLVQSQEPLPPSDDLPTDSRLPVHVVEILRAAVRAPEMGLEEVYSNASEEWGPLQDLIDQIEYECLLDLGRTEEADTVAGRLEPATVRLIQDGNGVIAAYRTIHLRSSN